MGAIYQAASPAAAGAVTAQSATRLLACLRVCLPAYLLACLLAWLASPSPSLKHNESSFYTLCHTEWADLIKSWALIMLGRGVEFQ